MIGHNNIVLHTERNLKKVGRAFGQFRCSRHKYTPNKKAMVFFYDQILVILPKFQNFSLIQTYNSAYIFLIFRDNIAYIKYKDSCFSKDNLEIHITSKTCAEMNALKCVENNQLLCSILEEQFRD